MFLRILVSLALGLLCIESIAKSQVKPPLQHAKRYQDNIELSDYWVSEKLDGVRGYWDGKQLYTRQGHKIHPPIYFTKHWPSIPLDGELWNQRDNFDAISACVRRTKVKNDCWQHLSFMIFDLPSSKENFTVRIVQMQQIITETASPHLKMIPQKQLNNKQQLFALLEQVTNNKGEGLMLHKGTSFYYVGRTSNIIKLKQHQDDEAEVIAHLPGKGKYKGMMGALLVRTKEGIEFKIGTGFSDQQRMYPPPLGSIITFKYIGKTKRGVPRFASFLRIRSSN